MVSSTVSHNWRRRGRAGATVLLLAGLVAALLGAAQPTADAPAGALELAPVACDSSASEVITELPWPHERYELDAVSEITDGANITVAVIDSGVDANHPQLTAAVLPGEDMLGDSGDGRTDCLGHGTAVASIIAAKAVAGVRMRGLAPGARILPIRVSERAEVGGVIQGSGDVRDLVAGIRAATTHSPRPHVINLSISTTWDDPQLRDAVAKALAADIVVVAAVGNQHERGDPTPYPAAYDGVIGVGAIGSDGLRAPMSQTGTYVDLMAPGDRITAAALVAGHHLFEGTSFAAPFVAATAALVRSRWPDLKQDEVVRRLLATADPAPGGRPSAEYGYGMVNPLRALTEILPRQRAAAVDPSDGPGPVEPEATDTDDALVSRSLGGAALVIVAAGLFATVAAAIPASRRRRRRPNHPAPGDPEPPTGALALSLAGEAPYPRRPTGRNHERIDSGTTR